MLFEKQRLQHIFNRRAAIFSEVSFLPREIAQRMHQRLTYIHSDPKRILDLGCGHGTDAWLLKHSYSNAVVYGLDLSDRMIKQGIRDSRRMDVLRAWFSKKGPYWVQGEFSHLPFISASFDLSWSNLALQWHPMPDQVLAEWQRVLKPGGILMFSTLGPDTLLELRRANQNLHRPRVIQFLDMHDFGDILMHNGFENPVMDMETLTLTYASSAALLKDVRRWGGYPAQRESEGLSFRDEIAALSAALEAQKGSDGLIRLTFEIVYGHAWKAQEDRQQTIHIDARKDSKNKFAKNPELSQSKPL